MRGLAVSLAGGALIAALLAVTLMQDSRDTGSDGDEASELLIKLAQAPAMPPIKLSPSALGSVARGAMLAEENADKSQALGAAAAHGGALHGAWLESIRKMKSEAESGETSAAKLRRRIKREGKLLSSSGGIATIIAQANAAANIAYLSAGHPHAMAVLDKGGEAPTAAGHTNMLAQEKAYLSDVDRAVQTQQKDEAKHAYISSIAQALKLKAPELKPAAAADAAAPAKFGAMPKVEGLSSTAAPQAAKVEDEAAAVTKMAAAAAAQLRESADDEYGGKGKERAGITSPKREKQEGVQAAGSPPASQGKVMGQQGGGKDASGTPKASGGIKWAGHGGEEAPVAGNGEKKGSAEALNGQNDEHQTKFELRRDVGLGLDRKRKKMLAELQAAKDRVSKLSEGHEEEMYL